MILEIQLPIPRADLPGILPLPTTNFILQLILPPHINHFPGNQNLRKTQRAQREAIPQLVRRSAVNLACYYSSRVAHGLLETDCSGAAVMRGDVYVEPGY